MLGDIFAAVDLNTHLQTTVFKMCNFKVLLANHNIDMTGARLPNLKFIFLIRRNPRLAVDS